MFVTEIEKKIDGLWFVMEEVCAYVANDPKFLIENAKRWALKPKEKIVVRKISDDADWNEEDYPEYENIYERTPEYEYLYEGNVA